jgi:hypothetical protein
VLEDGVAQHIRHFSTQALIAKPAGVDNKRLLRKADADAPLGSQDARIFLIVLGRGRLQPPGNGVDGMMHFVRDLLLPQDQVAVMAWNRATDFTSDHTQIAGMLERFKKRHEAIESELAMYFSGLRAVYGSPGIPLELIS